MDNIQERLSTLEEKAIRILTGLDDIDVDSPDNHEICENARKELREVITDIYELQKQAKTIGDYNAAREKLNISRSALRVYFHDYVSLDFVPAPKT